MGRRRRASGCGFWLLLAVTGGVYAFAEHAGEHWPFWLAALLIGLFLLAFFASAALEAWRRSRLLGLSLADLDRLSGKDFEAWIAARLTAAGIRVENLRDSADFGLDLIAEIDGRRIGIQAKRYTGQKVGNDAVMQTIAGLDYYDCPCGAVVTQSRFTAPAERQAERAHKPILLVDRGRLPRLPEALREFAARVEPA